MKLSKIRVINWKGKSFEFAPGKLNYCFHENGYGKTSLLDAIRYGLTGSLPAYDADGCAAEIVEASSGLDIYRARAGKSTACRLGGPEGKAATEKAVNKALADISSISTDNMKLLSSGDIFSRMKPDDFLSLLLEFIPEQLTYETVTSYIDGFTEDMDLLLEFYLPNEGTFGIQAIEDCATTLTEARKGLKANLVQNKQILASLKTGEATRTLEEIESELVDIQVSERMAEDIEKKQKEFEMISAKRAKQEKQIQDRKAWLETNQIQKTDPAAFAAWKKEREEKDAERKRLIANQAMVAAAITNLEKSLKYLDLPTCVISKTIACTTDKSKARGEVVEALDNNKKLLAKYQADIALCEARIAEIGTLIDGYYAADKRYNMYQRVINELKTLEDALVALPEKPAVCRKADLAERKKKLEEEKELVKAGIYRRKLEGMNRTLEADITTYTALIDALADKGPVKTGIIDYYVKEFGRACNTHAVQAKGFEITFIPDDGVKVYAKTPASSEPIYYTGLSSGEKIMVSFLVLDMLNQLTGMRMAFLDNLEQLDRRSLEYVHSILTSEEFLESYDHIFVCGVDNQDIKEIFASDHAVRI